MSGKQGAVLALHLALLSGCALVGPDHQTPTTELSAGFANANQPGLSTDPAHTGWWQGFKDQELERLVDLAVAGNPDLRIAIARLREARALWDETTFDRYPTVTADAAYSNEQQSETALQGFGGADRDRELYNAGFDARDPRPSAGPPPAPAGYQRGRAQFGRCDRPHRGRHGRSLPARHLRRQHYAGGE